MFNSTPVSLPSACRHSWKCSTCYFVVRSSGCVAKFVLVVHSSQTLRVSFPAPPTRGTVCAHVQCDLGCTSHLYQSLFDRSRGKGRERGCVWEGAVGGGAVWGAL